MLEEQFTHVETLQLSPCVCGGEGLVMRRQDKEKVPEILICVWPLLDQWLTSELLVTIPTLISDAPHGMEAPSSPGCLTQPSQEPQTPPLSAIP